MFNLFKRKQQSVNTETKISTPISTEPLPTEPLPTEPIKPVIKPPYSLPIYQDLNSDVYNSLRINSEMKMVDTNQITHLDRLIFKNETFKKLVKGDNISSMPNFEQFTDKYSFKQGSLTSRGWCSNYLQVRNLIQEKVFMNQDKSLTIKNVNYSSLSIQEKSFNINFLKSMYNLSSIYTESVLPDTFLTYINNNLIPLKGTNLSLSNMFIYLLVLNSSLKVNNGFEVLVSYSPTPEREYLISESLTDYHKLFVLSSTILPLTDKEILELGRVREKFSSSYHNLAIENIRNNLYRFKPDLSYISTKEELESYPIKTDYYNPKITFSYNYYKFISYSMFVRYLNFLSSKEDLKNIQPFLSLVALNKETESKINTILDKLCDTALVGKKPSNEALFHNLSVLNQHFDKYFKPFDEELERITAMLNSLSSEIKSIDKELSDLVSSLND